MRKGLVLLAAAFTLGTAVLSTPASAQGPYSSGGYAYGGGYNAYDRDNGDRGYDDRGHDDRGYDDRGHGWDRDEALRYQAWHRARYERLHEEQWQLRQRARYQDRGYYGGGYGY